MKLKFCRWKKILKEILEKKYGKEFKKQFDKEIKETLGMEIREKAPWKYYETLEKMNGKYENFEKKVYQGAIYTFSSLN